MRIRIYIFALIMLLAACRKEESKNNTTENKPPKSAVQVKVTKSITSQKLDSIDKSNAASIKSSGNNLTLAYVFYDDSTITLVGNMRADYRIFGYAKPDTKSEKLLLLSIYTSDVEGNPFKCKLGAYYDTSDMENLRLKYTETVGNFIKAVVIDKKKNQTVVYFEKKWIEFD